MLAPALGSLKRVVRNLDLVLNGIRKHQTSRRLDVQTSRRLAERRVRRAELGILGGAAQLELSEGVDRGVGWGAWGLVFDA
jgi:hypothetical protein